MSREGTPNVVLILTDDQGWGDLRCTGNTNLHTPRIDQLAADGATLEWFYVQPLCAPTRAELLTGRCFPRTGVKGVCLGAERLALDEVTVADLFRNAGYRTGCFGKWHSGQQYPYHPLGRGFDEFVGFCCGHWSHYFDSTIERDGVEFKSEGYLPDVLTDEALGFIETHREKPFFCYLPLNTPHSPFQVPDDYFARFKDHPLPLRAADSGKEDPEVTRSVLAMCENIDWNVGRVVDKLDQLDLTENTIVIYLSDNGPNSWRWNGGMAGMKGTAEEGGVRSPCFMRWPGRIQPGLRITRIAAAIDLLPTLADFCGLDISVTKKLDGVSLRPLLTETLPETKWPDRHLFAYRTNDPPTVSVRTQAFRAGGGLGGLYRPDVDPGQINDLSADQPEIFQSLAAAMQTWLAGMPDDAVCSALPVGYDAFPHAYIPTQDATLQGGLERSSIHPNCSYILNWTDVDASLTWELDVKQSGLYAVEIMYACSPENTGSSLELRAGAEFLRTTLAEPFDSPVMDKDDRVPRVESYDKAFTPLSMGVLPLTAGLQPLVLRCLEKPGPAVGEIRALKLTWLGKPVT